MPNVTIQASSVGTYPVACNWIGGSPILVGVTLGSTTMTTDFIIQYSLNDLQLSSNPTWFNVSSVSYPLNITSFPSTTVTAFHFSSAFADTPIVLSFENPVGAVRLNSTAISSSFLRFQVLQGESW